MRTFHEGTMLILPSEERTPEDFRPSATPTYPHRLLQESIKIRDRLHVRHPLQPEYDHDR